MRRLTNRELVLLSILVFLIFLFVFLIVTKPEIIFECYDKCLNDKIEIELNEDVSVNAKVTYLKKDRSNKVTVSGYVDNTKLGTYEINYNFKYFLYNINKKLTVTVVDKVAPKISLSGSSEVESCSIQTYKEDGFIATDNYDGDLTSNVERTIEGNVITYFVEDSSNNWTSVTRTIKPTDREAPRINLKGSDEIYIKKGGEYTDPGFELSDNCDTEINNYKIDNNLDVNKVGVYVYTYNATDTAGNTATSKRYIYVYNPVTSANMSDGEEGLIYLTFDDGPSSYTSDILDTLKKYGIKATFFVTNSGSDDLIKREYEEGHTVALHTASHSYKKVYSSVDNYFDDLESVQDRVYRITGEKSMIIRFPGGSSNTVSRSYYRGIMTILTDEVLERGYHYFDWNVSVEDAGSCAKKSDKEDCIFNYFKKGLSKNRSNVVLMHDVKSYTRNELEEMIQYAIKEGYTFDRITMDTPQVHHSVNN